MSPAAPALEREHVKHGDVMPFAKRGCNTCEGKGEFTKLTPSNTETGFKRTARICGCALRRFMRAKGSEVELIGTGESKALVWRKPVPEPETIPGTWKEGPGGVEIGERVDGSKHVHVHIKPPLSARVQVPGCAPGLTKAQLDAMRAAARPGTVIVTPSDFNPNGEPTT